MFLVPQLFFLWTWFLVHMEQSSFFQPYFNDPYFIKGHCILLCFIRKYIVTSEVTVSLCNSNSVVGRANVFIILSTNKVISLREPDYSQRLKKKICKHEKSGDKDYTPLFFWYHLLVVEFLFKELLPSVCCSTSISPVISISAVCNRNIKKNRQLLWRASLSWKDKLKRRKSNCISYVSYCSLFCNIL